MVTNGTQLRVLYLTGHGGGGGGGGAQVKHLRLRVYVQDNVGRQWGYDICAVGILAGLVVFLSGTRKYRFKKLVWRPLT